MADDALLENVKDRLATEQATYRDVMEHGSTLSVLHEAQRRLMQELHKVGETKDLETILLTEKYILANEREHYADTPVMEASLGYALNEIEAALVMVDEIQDPAAYKSGTDVYFRSHKSRIKGLPNDSARQFFKSHRSRLENHEKSRLMGIDKELIGVRKKNLDGSRKSYIELQENALANPEPELEIENNSDGSKNERFIKPHQ